MSWLQCFFRNRYHLLKLRENLKYKRSPTTTQKANCDITSVTGFVIKKNSSWGPEHGASERWCFSRRSRCLRKQDSQSTGAIRRFSHDGMHKKNTEIRWQKHDIGEKEVMFFDRIALERRQYSYESWTVTKRQTLDSSFEYCWAPTASSTATRVWTASSTATRICQCFITMS